MQLFGCDLFFFGFFCAIWAYGYDILLHTSMSEIPNRLVTASLIDFQCILNCSVIENTLYIIHDKKYRILKSFGVGKNNDTIVRDHDCEPV